ncbi:MAG: AbrB/MazE/SpoVT family DNA-binding domain-containing protein [Candidatus Accumulibacter sp.]|nr:AbrB/MazE/SpoVT family DNA-binding domain-containing protein [Accumulibacter sp.]
MIKTLTRHGNSYALVIDKPILELLNIAPETPLENGYELECDPDELADMVLEMARGGLDKAGVVEFVRLHAVELDK